MDTVDVAVLKLMALHVLTLQGRSAPGWEYYVVVERYRLDGMISDVLWKTEGALSIYVHHRIPTNRFVSVNKHWLN